MPLTIEIYENKFNLKYDYLLKTSPVAMFNHSLKYRDFLNQILNDCSDCYLCAFLQNELIAVLPTFIKHGPKGAVINSLPFYGSHGGFVYNDKADKIVFQALINEIKKISDNLNAFSCTIIESPFEKNIEKYDYFKAELFDNRIGQITHLPDKNDAKTVEAELLGRIHQKTRNMIRKGLKSCFDITHSNSKKTLEQLHKIHEENMASIGGKAKPWFIFEAIQKIFLYDQDYRVYYASKNGQLVSGLLVFYFKDMVEYFTPASLECYRSEQPLSAIIYIAMKDAILEKNCRYWNWGGTWLTQKGVYHFKSRWGTTDYPYRYHTRINSGIDTKKIIKDEFISEYPFFYGMPFSAPNQ